MYSVDMAEFFFSERVLYMRRSTGLHGHGVNISGKLPKRH